MVLEIASLEKKKKKERKKRYGRSPVLIGIHYRKTFSTYLFFASSLIGHNPQLQGVRVFGTDGEQALIDAFSHEFTFSQHLTCFVHVRRNIKQELEDGHIPCKLSQKFLDDIFGQRLWPVFVEGLVDASDEDDFQVKLDSNVKYGKLLTCQVKLFCPMVFAKQNECAA